MNITDVRMRRIFDDNALKAICSVTIDGELAIHDIKLVKTGEKMLVVMPAKKTGRGEFVDIVHPINSGTRAMLENAIISEYNLIIKKR